MKLGKYMKAQAIGVAPEAYSITTLYGNLLGHVEWYPRWKQYVFTDAGSAFSTECLQELALLCAQLTEGHYETTKTTKSNGKRG